MSSSKAKLLVIGGTGFIGSYICEEGLKRDMIVSSLSLNSKGSSKNINYIHSNITNLSEISNNIGGQQYDYVINCGGYIDHSEYFNGGRQVINSHLLGLYNIINTLNLSSVARFIHLGSSDEYGLIAAPQLELNACYPISSYAYAKFSASKLFEFLGKYEGYNTSIIRLFLVYGPGQKDNRLLPYLIKKLLDGEEVNLSPGNQLRDFCYIDDIVRGIFCCLESKKNINGEIFNLCSSIPISIKDVAIKTANLINADTLKFGNIDYRRNENMELWGCNNKASDVFLWKPQVSIEEGLKNTINSYKKSY